MLLALLLVLAITAGGFAATYLFENDEPFLWRCAAGAAIGSTLLGTTIFVLALVAGLTPFVAAVGLFVTLLPIAFIVRGPRRRAFQLDWQRAKGKVRGASIAKAASFLYYAGFLLLFILFFAQAMYVTDNGIFTGGSNNLGDLPFHLGAILSFTDGANFPPQNPSFAGARFSYPFIADLVTAAFVKLGSGLREAMVVQDIAWAFALFVLLERFVLRLIGDRTAAKLAAPILFFSGGLGFVWFFADLGAQSKGLADFLWQIPKDYTIGDQFRWGNSLVTLFMTQRSLLLGMPLAVIILGWLWKVFSAERTQHAEDRKELVPAFLVGCIAGFLPLVHLHSLAVLFVVTGSLFFLRFDRWRSWLVFGVGVCVIAVPELAWSLSGSASETTKFFAWHFGWDSRDTNIIWFWIKNTGAFFFLLAFGMILILRPPRASIKSGAGQTLPPASTLLLFYIPFAALFVIANVAKLAPWEWDNIKVLIYWWIASIPFVAFAVAWMWQKGAVLKVAAAVCFLVLIFSGALDVWRTVSGTVKTRVFDADAVKLADRLRSAVPQKALFLNAPTYNSAVVLTGRQSLMRYSGHLSSHGTDYIPRENDVKKMYAGGPQAEELLRKYAIDYVLISPEERTAMRANESFFSRFPVVAEAGQYKVYKIK